METNGYLNAEDKIPVISLICSNCQNIQLSLSDLQDKTENGHRITTYTLKCNECGAVCSVTENWDLSKADPDKKSDAVVIGIL